MNSLTVFIGRQDIDIAEKSYDIYVDLAENGGFYMKMFMPQALNYLDQYFEKTLGTLNTDLEKHEINKDALYADQTRTKIKAYEVQRDKYKSFAEELQKESAKGH